MIWARVKALLAVTSSGTTIMVLNPSALSFAPNIFVTSRRYSPDQMPPCVYPGSLMMLQYGISSPWSRHRRIIAMAHSTYSSGLDSDIHASTWTMAKG